MKEADLSLGRSKRGFLFQDAAPCDSSTLDEDLEPVLQRLTRKGPEGEANSSCTDYLVEAGLAPLAKANVLMGNRRAAIVCHGQCHAPFVCPASPRRYEAYGSCSQGAGRRHGREPALEVLAMTGSHATCCCLRLRMECILCGSLWKASKALSATERRMGDSRVLVFPGSAYAGAAAAVSACIDFDQV